MMYIVKKYNELILRHKWVGNLNVKKTKDGRYFTLNDLLGNQFFPLIGKREALI